MYKKISFSVLLGSLLLPFVASAQLHSYGPAYSLTGIIDSIINVSWIIFAAIAVICFLVAGILFLTAQGEPEKIKTARSAFIWGIAGVVVGIIAYSIISIVGSFIS